MPIFSDILNKGRTSLQNPGLRDSRDWFREKAREVNAVNATKIINGNRDYQKSIIQPGFMYLFAYDPKYKDTLPYYDRFPLVFPFKVEGDSFLGMNMHYLPHLYRAKLMDALYGLTNNVNFNDKTKLRLSYELLNSSAKYKYFEPCIKRYLVSHLKTRFLMIPSNEWDIALFLPLERFTKSKSIVYRDSLNTIRRT